MSAPDRFKPYAPDVQAVVRLEGALPPEADVSEAALAEARIALRELGLDERLG